MPSNLHLSAVSSLQLMLYCHLLLARTLPSNSTAILPARRNAALYPIQKGYVAFGDSFAAGFGTGITTTDPCRQGEFSYPKLLANTTVGINFQNLACSGAVIADIIPSGGQIDAWENPVDSDIATISIGGNDVGFSKILDACILQVMGGVGQVFSYDCQARINDAMAVMSGKDLYQDIFKALTEIITKSGREDFKIYFTGYPAFFNVDTTYCNSVTFFYASPHHAPLPINDGYPYLSQELRLQLNDLLQSLNQFLSDLIRDFNGQSQFASNPQVVFVPTDPVFNGHRFCEDGVQEPDPANPDNWFFLSGWADNSLPGTDIPLVIEDLVTEGNTTALTDPQVCDPYKGDPGTALQCRTAIAVQAPGSEMNMIFNEDMQLVAQQDFSEVQMPWWLPTRQGKTFHPRTLGHLAYKNAILGHF